MYRSLEKHTGLPVLWTLGALQDRMTRGAFWYLPEVDLYEGDEDPTKKNEIDILCMVDGEFNAVEVKRSASMFLNKEGAQDKFVKVVGMLRPDIALLAFEKYCVEGEDANAIRVRLTEAAGQIRERIGPWTKLRVLVAYLYPLTPVGMFRYIPSKQAAQRMTRIFESRISPLIAC